MGSSTESNAEIGPVVGSDEMDVDWFNRTMPDRLGGGRVDSVDGRPIGTGQVGENIRYRLTAGDGGVTTVVGKFPSDNEQSFATAQQMGIYASEVGFYRDVAPKLRIRVPEVYYIGFDPATTRFCLVMEDISPAVQGDQMAGTDVATARAAAIRQTPASFALIASPPPTHTDSCGPRVTSPATGDPSRPVGKSPRWRPRR